MWCVIVLQLAPRQVVTSMIDHWDAIGSYREIAIAIESEAGDSLTSIDQSGFSRKERNLHCDVHETYTSPLKTNTYCRRSGRQTRCG